jgi:hypothetical protein
VNRINKIRIFHINLFIGRVALDRSADLAAMRIAHDNLALDAMGAFSYNVVEDCGPHHSSGNDRKVYPSKDRPTLIEYVGQG